MTKIIGITGYKRSGKTTTANILKEKLEKEHGQRVLILSLADPIKEIVSEALNISRKELEIAKENNGEVVTLVDTQVFGDATIRHILQTVGQEVKNYAGSYVWVDYLINHVNDHYEDYDVFIVPDVRFPFEAASLKEEFGEENVIIVKVEAGITNDDQHPSEKFVNSIHADVLVHNDRKNMKRLEEQVSKLIEEKIKSSSEELYAPLFQSTDGEMELIYKIDGNVSDPTITVALKLGEKVVPLIFLNDNGLGLSGEFQKIFSIQRQ